MNKQIYTYKEVIKKIKDELIHIDNILEFSKKHNLSYQILILVKTKELTKEYPTAIAKIYKAIFNKKIQIQKMFVEK